MTSKKNIHKIKFKIPEPLMKESFNEIITENYIIAYIDILGTKDTINSDASDNHLKALHDLYNKTLTNIYAIKHQLALEDIKIKIFSDNIIFALKVNKTLKKETIIEYLSNIVYMLRFFQLYTLLSGHAIRGCVTFGKLFINDVFTYGKGLLTAYKMEENLAIFPRILVDQNLLQDIEYNKSITMYLKKDFDGIYFIDFFEPLFSGTCDLTLMDIRQIIVYLTQQANDIKPKQKYYWLINKFNEKCNKKYKKYLINIEKEQLLEIKWSK